jgi:non-ribosomal peptide synthetase component E (peptide arylation enzyme)
MQRLGRFYSCAIYRYRVTNASLIPSVIHQLVNHPKTKEADLSSLVTVVSGAAYLPPELATKLQCICRKDMLLTEGLPFPL